MLPVYNNKAIYIFDNIKITKAPSSNKFSEAYDVIGIFLFTEKKWRCIVTGCSWQIGTQIVNIHC
jgi:hypothetical protein